MRNNFILALLLSGALFFMIGLVGCDTEGPAENAGEKIDQSVESAKDAVENAGDKMTGKGTAEQAGENVEEAVEDAKDAVDSKTD